MGPIRIHRHYRPGQTRTKKMAAQGWAVKESKQLKGAHVPLEETPTAKEVKLGASDWRAVVLRVLVLVVVWGGICEVKG